MKIIRLYFRIPENDRPEMWWSLYVSRAVNCVTIYDLKVSYSGFINRITSKKKLCWDISINSIRCHYFELRIQILHPISCLSSIPFVANLKNELEKHCSLFIQTLAPHLCLRLEYKTAVNPIDSIFDAHVQWIISDDRVQWWLLNIVAVRIYSIAATTFRNFFAMTIIQTKDHSIV